MDYRLIRTTADELGTELTDVTDNALRIALDDVKTASQMYSMPAFEGGTDARNVLDNHLHGKAIHDRGEIVELIAAAAYPARKQ